MGGTRGQMTDRLKLHGTLMANLQGALKSAKRLEGQRVYAGTLEHWQAIVDEARRRFKDDSAGELTHLHQMVADLEYILAGRKVMGGRPS